MSQKDYQALIEGQHLTRLRMERARLYARKNSLPIPAIGLRASSDDYKALIQPKTRWRDRLDLTLTFWGKRAFFEWSHDAELGLLSRWLARRFIRKYRPPALREMFDDSQSDRTPVWLAALLLLAALWVFCFALFLY